MQGLATYFVVEDQLRQAECEYEVEHAGSGDRVNAGDCGEEGAGEGFTACLCIQELAVRQRHVGLGRQVQ